MLSSLDITRILTEAAHLAQGAHISSIEYYRKERALQLYFKAEKSYCLTLSFHPQLSSFYILPAGQSRLETTEKYRPFARDIWEGQLVSIRQIPNDRIVEIEVVREDRPWFLIFEILGPNGNVWLLDQDKKVIASLREKPSAIGRPHQPASLPQKLNPYTLDNNSLETLLAADSDMNLGRRLEKSIYGIDYYLAGYLLGDSEDNSEKYSSEQTATVLERLQQVLSLYRSSHGPIYAYRIRGKIHFYPVVIAGHQPLGTFTSLSIAQQSLRTAAREESESETLHEKTITAIENKIKKTEKLLIGVNKDIDEASDFERYRQYADLLKINLGHLKRGMKSITVDDLFNESRVVDIPLDPKLSGRENMENYSKRYRKGKEGLALLMRRRDNIAEEIHSLNEARQSFQADFEAAAENYPQLVPAGAAGKAKEPAVRLPYKEYRASTGLTIFVGKTGDDNDRTTFGYAKPYELWFHASQCPGSHVVMKFPHKNFQPSKREIEETAALAAYFSKARGSARVAVSYTEKRYVRKPRKAKAGLVTIEHEKTIMVAPRELEKK